MNTLPNASIFGAQNGLRGLLQRELEGRVQLNDGLSPAEAGGPQAPAVAFVVASDDGEAALALVRRSLRQAPATPVLLVCRRKDPDLILKALRCGVADYLALPEESGTLETALARVLGRTEAAGSRGEVTAVFSLKGGQGVTSLAVNLADQLHLLAGERVALLDLNLYMGDSALMLSSAPAYTPFDLVRDLPRMDADLLFSSLFRHPRGFHLLAATAEIGDPEQIDGNDVSAVLAFLQRHLGQVVIDLPHDFGERTVATMQAADRLLLVVQQTTPAVKSVQSTLQLLDELGFENERIKIVVNRFTAGGDLGRDDLAYVLQRPVYAEIRNDYDAVTRAVNAGQPLAAAFPRGAITRDVAQLAARLAGVEIVAAAPAGPVRRLLHRLGMGGPRP